MAGIKTLSELYSKLGENELRKLLQSDIRITEKFDAYRFSFEKNAKDYKLYYYGKNGKVPLSKIERTLSDLYEGAINYINNLHPDIKTSLPLRHRFGFSWFPTNNPLSLNYEKKPNSGLILTDITIRDKKNDVSREISDSSVLESWSKILKVDYAKPLHEGKLSEQEINSLINIAKNKSDFSLLTENFNTKGYLNESSTQIDSLIFEVNDQLFKIESQEVQTVSEKRSHLFDILLLDILEHTESFNILGLSPQSDKTDEAYIEAVCEIFNDYVSKRGNTYLESGMKKPDFLEKAGSFNSSWIQNKNTQKILESNKDYKYLLSIFLANLRKPKFKSGLLSESIANRFNTRIEELNQVIGNDYSFLEFSTIIKEQDALAEKTSEPDYVKSVNLLIKFFDSERINTSGKEKVNVILCNAGFLTNRIKDEAESAFKLNGLKSIIMHSKDLLRKHIGISEESVERLLSQYISDNNDLFIDYKIIDLPIFYSLLDKCRSEYEPAIIIGNFNIESLIKEYTGYCAILSDEQKTLKKDLKITYFKDKDKDLICKAIDQESYKNYCSLTPSCMHPYWTEVKKSFNDYTYK